MGSSCTLLLGLCIVEQIAEPFGDTECLYEHQHPGAVVLDSAHRWREGTIRACTADGWKVEFSGKPGTVAKAAIFDTKELESLA